MKFPNKNDNGIMQMNIDSINITKNNFMNLQKNNNNNNYNNILNKPQNFFDKDYENLQFNKEENFSEKEKLKLKYNSKISKEFMNYQNQLRGYNDKIIDYSCNSYDCSKGKLK